MIPTLTIFPKDICQLICVRRAWYSVYRPVLSSQSVTGYQPVALDTIGPLPKYRVKKQRIGRGGKRGGSSGRGQGGQKHHGKAPPPWFSSLATNSIIEALPQWPWAPRAQKPRYRSLNLDRLQFWIDSGRLKPDTNGSGVITIADLYKCGIIPGRIKYGIKLLGNGSEYFTHKNINIEVTKASKSAIAAIERNNGSVTCIYHTRSGLRQHLKNDKMAVEHYFEPPILEKDIEYYVNPANRGYLADKERFDKIYRPRGYTYSAEEYDKIASPEKVSAVKVRYQVENMSQLLKEMNERRAWRQMWYEKEQESLSQAKSKRKLAWKNQQWFPDQDEKWKWENPPVKEKESVKAS